MMNPRKSFLTVNGVVRFAAMALFALAIAGAGPASAQKAYPERPIRIVIGFAAGGGTDAVLRVLAVKLGNILGVPVLVDNKPGANGNIASDIVSKADPDGYTFVYNTSSMVLSPFLYTGLSYDYKRDLAPVSLVANIPLLLIANPNVPVSNVEDFAKYVRAHGDKMSYASAGKGNITHLGMLYLLHSLHGTGLHVAYRSEAPALTDLLAGQVQFYMGTANALIPLVKQNKLKGLAIGSAQRSPDLPEVPTLGETIMKGVELGAWSGVMAPAKTPKPIIEKMNAAILAALRDKETHAKIVSTGAEVRGTSPEEYASFIASEAARWGEIVKANDIKPD
jgi:tripartite-type tricarboxylate transporter receptor subunit TctC